MLGQDWAFYARDRDSLAFEGPTGTHQRPLRLEIAPDREKVPSRPNSLRVAVDSIGSHQAGGVGSILSKNGIQLDAGAPIRVVEVDHYLQPGLKSINEEALRTETAWLPVCSRAATPWVGPLFVPGETACWTCLVARLRENGFAEPEACVGTNPHDPVEKGPIVGPTQALAALVVLQTFAKRSYLRNGLWRLEPAEPRFTRHEVVPRDNCPSCDPGRRSPRQKERELARHVSGVTGVVARLRPLVAERERSLHVWAADHAYVKRSRPDAPRDGEFGKSVGKGRTESEAKMGALCEALERYSGLFRGDEVRITSDLQSLGARGIHPNRCMNFSDRQYRERDGWNQAEADFNWIPEPFDQNKVVEWSPLRPIRGGESRYLPTGYCYYGYRPALELPYFRPDSNGSAAGSTLTGAIFSGLMEVVERDAVAIWWYNRLPRPAVDLDSFKDPFFRGVQNYYRSLGRDLWVLNLTTDVGIPVFAAISVGAKTRGQDLALGFGAHLDSEIAVGRALSEASQFLPVLRTGRQGRAWAYRGRLSRRRFLWPDSERRRPATELVRLSSGEEHRDLDRAVDLVEGLGLEAYYLDQSRGDVGLPVVKVVVPGMRQIWPRFGPGRLYQAPVKLGILPRPKREASLNPAHLLL